MIVSYFPWRRRGRVDAVCDTRGSKIAAKFIPSFKMSSRFRESNHTRLRRLRAAERAPAGSGSRLRTLAELFEQRVCFLLCVSFTLKSWAWTFSSPEHTRGRSWLENYECRTKVTTTIGWINNLSSVAHNKIRTLTFKSTKLTLRSFVGVTLDQAG